jgi:hypothetical protein
LKLPLPDNQLPIKKNIQAITLLLPSRVIILLNNLGSEEKRKEPSADREAMAIVKTTGVKGESAGKTDKIVLEERIDKIAEVIVGDSAEEEEEEMIE